MGDYFLLFVPSCVKVSFSSWRKYICISCLPTFISTTYFYEFSLAIRRSNVSLLETWNQRLNCEVKAPNIPREWSWNCRSLVSCVSNVENAFWFCSIAGIFRGRKTVKKKEKKAQALHCFAFISPLIIPCCSVNNPDLLFPYSPQRKGFTVIELSTLFSPGTLTNVATPHSTPHPICLLGAC